MNGRQRLFSIIIGVIGSVASSIALGRFIIQIGKNALELPDLVTAQSFYQSVGKAYSAGFVAGFALCFSLMLLAVAVGTYFDDRKTAKAATKTRSDTATETVPIPLGDPAP